MAHLEPPVVQQAQLIGGVWRIDFPSNNNLRLVNRVAFSGGPAFTTASIYIDTQFMDITSRSDLNSADWPVPLWLAAGSTFSIVWGVGTGGAPIGVLYCTGEVL